MSESFPSTQTITPPTAWDPLVSWPVHYRYFGALLGIIVLAIQGWSFVASFWPPLMSVKTGQGLKEVPNYEADYFQDWVSGRHWWEKREIYPRLAESMDEYMGPDPNRKVYVERNAHPPASVLMVIPFTWFDYQLSYLLWDLSEFLFFVLGVWLIGRELSLRWSWPLILMLSGVMMFCGPLRQQVLQGQFNGLLVLMVAAAWRDSRSGHLARAGVWLAIATAVKLYPGFLFVHFLVRRQWRLVLVGSTAFLAIMTMTWVVLGTDAFLSYVTEVMPLVSQCRAGWPNASLAGIWSKLFDAGNGNDAARLVLLWPNPILCRAGIATSVAVVLGLWLWALLRPMNAANPTVETARNQGDLCFCLSLFAMSLVSPVTWDHYLLVMILPLLVMARQLTWLDWRAWVLACLAGVCCLSPPTLWWLVSLDKDDRALPWQVITALSLHLYALWAWFGLNLHMLRTVEGDEVSKTPVGGAHPTL